MSIMIAKSSPSVQIVSAWPWIDGPVDNVILGLKELLANDSTYHYASKLEPDCFD